PADVKCLSLLYLYVGRYPRNNASRNKDIAAALVDDKLAACVNIASGIQSVYSWQGKVEQDSELLLIIKTHGERIPALQQAIHDRHPYEVPEIISLPIESGSDKYLAWLGDAVRLT
ncbi:MAG: divalent cation tolerance protein, partial [Candidatus Kentron sp. G]